MAFVASLAVRSLQPTASSFTRSSRCFATSHSRSLATTRRCAPVTPSSPASRRRFSMAAPKEGSPAPDFTATDTDGNAISLSALRGGNVVLYFMAGAGPGCTSQACAFRDAAADFADLDATIIAVSAQNDGADFKSRNSLPYAVISDGDKKLQKLYGVSATFGLIPGRVTYTIDKEGIIRSAFNKQFGAEEHVKVARETIKTLA